MKKSHQIDVININVCLNVMELIVNCNKRNDINNVKEMHYVMCRVSSIINSTSNNLSYMQYTICLKIYYMILYLLKLINLFNIQFDGWANTIICVVDTAVV